VRHLVRHAAEEEAPVPVHALAADHDQVGALLLGHVQDGFRRIAGAGVANRLDAHRARGAGDPADAILDVAEEERADLIVVGNKGMTGAKRFLLGSVPNKVSHHAPCSVMIIRTT